jgi:hypothetical protein
MKEAMDKDNEEFGNSRYSTTVPRFITRIQRTRTEDASSRVVEFHLLRSITDNQPTIVQRERRLSYGLLGI